MSDEPGEAAVTEAAPATVEPQTGEPVTPATEAEPDVQEAVAPEPSKPTSIAEIRQTARRSIREKADAAEAARRENKDQPDQLRDEQGRFIAPSVEASAEAEPAAEPAPLQPDPAVPTEPEASETEPLPEGWVKVEVPEGNVLRDARKETFIAVPPEWEARTRHLLKLDRQDRDWDGLRGRLNELGQLNISAQAEAEYWKGKFKPVVDDAALEGMLADFHQGYDSVYGPDKVDEMFAGLRSKALGEDTAELEEARQQKLWEAEAERIGQHTNQFVDYTMRDAVVGVDGRPPRFPGWTRDDVAEALQAYGMYLKAKNRGDVDGSEFIRMFGMPMYLASPVGQKYGAEAAQRLQRQGLDQARIAGRKEAEEAEQLRLKDAAERHQTNPVGRLPLTKSLAARGVEAPPEKQKPTGDPAQIRRRAHAAIKERYAR